MRLTLSALVAIPYTRCLNNAAVALAAARASPHGRDSIAPCRTPQFAAPYEIDRSGTHSATQEVLGRARKDAYATHALCAAFRHALASYAIALERLPFNTRWRLTLL